MKQKLTVGQELWYVSRRRYSTNKWVTVTKVGRKWATLDTGQRIDIETWEVDGGGYTSIARCYLSVGECEDERELEDLWRLLRDRTSRFTVPDGLTAEDVRKAMALLKLEIEVPQ